MLHVDSMFYYGRFPQFIYRVDRIFDRNDRGIRCDISSYQWHDSKLSRLNSVYNVWIDDKLKTIKMLGVKLM